jgi:hypothetical protein
MSNNNRVVNYAAGEKLVKQIALGDIHTRHNYRNPAPSLISNFVLEGIVSEDDNTVPLNPVQFVHQYALSTEPAKRQKFVELMEKYETGSDDIVALANSRRNFVIHPINLRSYRIRDRDNGGYMERYGLIAGERRYLASAYNHVKHGDKAVIGAISQNMTEEQATDMAFEENLKQRPPTPLEYGRRFREYTERVNPDTGKNYTLKEVADKFGLEYSFVRTREALTYNTPADQARLDAVDRVDPFNPDKKVPKMRLTSAVERGLAIKSGKTSTPEAIRNRKETRRRAMTLAEVQEHFDVNRDKSKDYMTALAVIMRMTLDEAEKESDLRFQVLEEAEVKTITQAENAA